MSAFDIIIIVLLAASAIYGFAKGFVMQITGLLALFLGVFCAFKFSGWVAGWVSKWIEAGALTTSIIAFIITIIAVWIAIILLGKTMESMVKAAALSFINRLLGLVFAVVQTVFIIGVMLYALSYLPVTSEVGIVNELEKSKLYTPLKRTAELAFPYLHFK